ncbi:MAG TPA: ABC transporter ATP-binding protein [Polyangiaceae bacterium]|nr:ABC transporter ATP-binding protein [Polyangiaceae bacterium]
MSETLGGLLGIEGLSLQFGGVYAIRDVNMNVERGELRGIIGPNGAGKSTLFHLVSGHLRPDAGSVTFGGDLIDRLKPHARAQRGIAIVFQGARVFRGMTVRENVMVGAHARTRHGFVEAALRLPRHLREEHEIRRSADAALEQVGLSSWADRTADALPLGQQRCMQVARALCAKPSQLLLDEPASGLRANERERLADLIAALREAALTILLIEHDVSFVTRLADRITVLDLGRVISEGTPDEVRRDDRVIAAYLGRSPS